MENKQLIKLGQDKYDECEYEEAIEYFNLVLQDNPDDFDTLISRGMAKGQLDMHEDAIRRNSTVFPSVLVLAN